MNSTRDQQQMEFWYSSHLGAVGPAQSSQPLWESWGHWSCSSRISGPPTLSIETILRHGERVRFGLETIWDPIFLICASWGLERDLLHLGFLVVWIHSMPYNQSSAERSWENVLHLLELWDCKVGIIMIYAFRLASSLKSENVCEATFWVVKNLTV